MKFKAILWVISFNIYGLDASSKEKDILVLWFTGSVNFTRTNFVAT